LIPFVFFQNCSLPLFSNQSSSADSGGGGHTYDGKIYIQAGTCSDGTLVKWRIIAASATSAIVVRENCMNLPVPRTLTAGEFSIDPVRAETLTYNGETFVAERIEVRSLKASYMQWSNGPRSIPTPVFYFADGIGFTTAQLNSIKSEGHTLICMITAGVYTSNDPDAGDFNAGDIGNQSGSTNEYWLDTRSANVRAIMERRLDMAKSKGCDGVMWDQTDGYLNTSGFPLNQTTAIDYARFLAMATHDRKMVVSLANTGLLAADLVDYFDLVSADGCYASGTCSRYEPFAAKKKPVAVAESSAFSSALCDQARASAYTLWFGTANRDGSRYEPCP
jgi:hypothetical protein